MEKLTHFSLFSGIGGIDLAAEWAGFETVGQCEWADYPTKVLEKHWPDVPRWRDIRDVRHIPKMTLLTAGIPCQEHSSVNKKRTGDLFEWQQTHRIAKESHPDWILIENVNGILTTAHDSICDDLEREGYEVQTYNYPALAVGAHHERYRVFIVANTSGESITQTNKTASTIREERNAWEDDLRCAWGSLRGTYWGTHKPPVCGVVNGIADRFYKDRMRSLGNMVVPQQVYPILKAVADIEKERINNAT